nr:GNAT family N-acetyltransferase [Bradyrhizobium sp. AUGA SZCCT0182]
MMKGDPIPFAVVAADGDRYLGSTLGIACDLPERRQYAPWVAAVWVEPEHRRQEVGRALVRHAAQCCFERSFPRAYLCSSLERLASTRGWDGPPSSTGWGSITRRSMCWNDKAASVGGLFHCLRAGFNPQKPHTVPSGWCIMSHGKSKSDLQDRPDRR